MCFVVSAENQFFYMTHILPSKEYMQIFYTYSDRGTDQAENQEKKKCHLAAQIR